MLCMLHIEIFYNVLLEKHIIKIMCEMIIAKNLKNLSKYPRRLNFNNNYYLYKRNFCMFY